jgi:hypothetical protein
MRRFIRSDLYLSPSFESELASVGDRLYPRETDVTISFTDKDPLPQLSVSGCTVFYAGEPIYEAASPDAAIIYLDRHINVYE